MAQSTWIGDGSSKIVRQYVRARILFCSITLGFLVGSTAHADGQGLEKKTLFAANTSGVHLYRIPGIVVTAKGTVLAYCEARRASKADWGEIEIHLRRSSDFGRTWSNATQIAHMGERIEGNTHRQDGGEHEQTVNNPVAIVDHQKGTIEFLYCVNYAQCFSMRSSDDGLTWSQPTEITKSLEPFRKSYDWKVIATGPGHGVQLASGRLVVPIWLAYGSTGDHKPSAAATIYSDDHGLTWQAGEIAVPNQGQYGNPNETTIAILADGRVMLVSRNVSPPNRKLVTTSADGASGWSQPVFHDQLWEPICMASIVAHSSSPSTLLFSCPRSLAVNQDGAEIPGGRGARRNLSIQRSNDDGATWPIIKTLDAGPSAYSDLAVLSDGTVLCFYETDSKIVVARFGLEWLHQP